jgi:hypothetical protein
MTTNLPDDCQRLLDLARDGHDPVGPEARVRVRQAVAASLALSAAGVGGSIAPAAVPAAQGAASGTLPLSGSAAHTTAGGKASFTLFGAKLGALAAAAVVAAGIGIAAYGSRQPSAQLQLPNPSVVSPPPAPIVEPTGEPRVEPTGEPSVEPMGEPRVDGFVTPTTPELAQDDQAALVGRAPVRRNGKPLHSGGTLAAETVLLRRASEALAHGDEPLALDALLSHAKQFPQGSLREERDGLRAIAECSRETTPSSASAKRFARVYPNSMLGARVAKACEGK